MIEMEIDLRQTSGDRRSLVELEDLERQPAGDDSREEIGVRGADVHGHVRSRAGADHEHAIVVHGEMANGVAEGGGDEIVIGAVPARWTSPNALRITVVKASRSPLARLGNAPRSG